MLELLVVILILSLLLIASLAGLRALRRNVDVETESNEMLATLQLARNQALVARDQSAYGVHFANNQYVLFKGTTYDSASSDNEVHQLSSKLEIYSISLAGGGSDVIFDRSLGTTANAGDVSIRLIEQPTNFRTITILASGQAGAQGTVNPTDTRLTDTRHLHFDLGWSIQGATTLTLQFSDSPNPDVIENVTMTPYFNSGQTAFNWTGTVNVYGEDQTLRVHTHSLDSANTILSIHRDRRYNTKAVTVLIDGFDIVSYAADGTAAVGSAGGTMEQQ